MENIKLKEVDELIKTLTTFAEKEKEKFRVGLLLGESIRALQTCASSLEQLRLRGEKVDSTRNRNIKNLKKIRLNLIEVCKTLGIGGSSG